MEEKQKQVELLLQLVKSPQVCPWHSVLVQTPFSQTPDEQTVPREPQFLGSVEVFAVQLGLLEVVGYV